MSNVVRALLFFAVMVVTACATPTAKLSSADAAQLKGKGIKLSIVPAGSPASNLNGAMIFGALGQAIQGSSMQEKLQMVDPAIKVEENIKSLLAKKLNTTNGGDFNLKIHTSYWWIGKPIGAKDENIVTAAIIEMTLVDSAGRILASDTFNGTNDSAKTPISSDDVTNGNVERIRAALADVAEKATSKFTSTLAI